MELGTIFSMNEYPLGYDFAMANGYTIKEVNSKQENVEKEVEYTDEKGNISIKYETVVETVRYFQIVEIPQPTEEEIAEMKRADRDRLLSDSDKRMLPDFPISEEEKEQWLLYREYLRNITDDPKFPNVDVLSFENWLGQIHSKEPVLKA